MTTSTEFLQSLNAEEVATNSLSDAGSRSTQISQTRHRIAILKAWQRILSTARSSAGDAQPQQLASAIGSKVLDIGCGQGDHLAATAALLEKQGVAATVVGIDPARLDYGAPYTLGQAQKHLSESSLGPHISWVQNDPVRYLESAEGKASPPSSGMLVHSIYYLPTAATFGSILAALHRSGAQHVFLAEWALSIGDDLQALPHLLSVLLQSVEPLPEGNIRTVLSPSEMLKFAERAGWELVGSEIMKPADDVQDGGWEAAFSKSIAREVFKEERALSDADRTKETIRKASIRAHGEALLQAIQQLPEGKTSKTKPMNVWAAVLKRK